MAGGNLEIGGQAMVEPAADEVAAGAPCSSHLRVASAAAQVTRPARGAGLLAIDPASIEKCPPRYGVDAALGGTHTEPGHLDGAVAAMQLTFSVERQVIDCRAARQRPRRAAVDLAQRDPEVREEWLPASIHPLELDL